MDLFYGVDYHSHLGTRRGGMATHGADGFCRSIHNIENSPFRTKFERDVEEPVTSWKFCDHNGRKDQQCGRTSE